MIIFFISATFGVIPSSLVWIAGIYLIIKGLAFAILLDPVSIIDIIVGIIILLSLAITIHPLLIAVISVYLLQKGLMSLVA